MTKTDRCGWLWLSLILMVVVGLAGCGQKGDLYFPDQRAGALSLQP